jgi:glutaminyl-tRNA synthetase
MAEYLIEQGYAYVDSQSAEDMAPTAATSARRARTRRSATVPRRIAALFRDMKAGKYADGEHILRAKISEDARSPNMNLRDPAIYRIRHAHHVRTGDAWCIYPMYDYAPDFGRAGKHHPLDLHAGIPGPPPVLRLAAGNPVARRLLQAAGAAQYEFSRLNLTYVVTSKRKLRQLVEEKIVDGWDDPRMPTIVGLRRRGYTPEAIQLFCERIGVTKADGWIDMSTLEGCVRDLDPKAPRATAVLRPLKLIIDNFPKARRRMHAPVHPHHPEMGVRTFPSRASCGSRRLHGSADQGLLPLLPADRRQAGQPRAPALRLRDRVHGLRQG